MRDRNLSKFKSECRYFPRIYDFRKRAREKLRETEYYLSKPDQIHSHMFAFRSNDSGIYWRNVAKKDQCEDMIRTVDQWMGQINQIIDNVPAVSMKYFIWVIWLEQKNYRKVAEHYNVNPEWLSRMIRKQLKDSFQITGINAEDIDISNMLTNSQRYYHC